MIPNDYARALAAVLKARRALIPLRVDDLDDPRLIELAEALARGTDYLEIVIANLQSPPFST